jgi:hypothetical protein
MHMTNISKLDSAFQLQEHLKALHYRYSKPSESEGIVPINRETAIQIAGPPEGVDRALWLYELCRFLINKCNDLIIGFLFDDPPCSATTCPEMRASEWQFLCAVHESPKSCCAIDYCCHTLDWATNIVTSQKIFPSRLSLGAGDAVDERGAGVKHLTNIFRRLHRIFAHAWFQHRGVFWQVETQTGLYVLFKTVCDTYNLLPPENYKLPPEAEGLEPVEEVKVPAPTIMKSGHSTGNNLTVEEQDFANVGRNNTRRHIRQSPSVGSAVTTVLESDEEETDVTQKLDDLQITDDDPIPEEEGETEIPVIVESYEVDEAREAEAEPESEKPALAPIINLEEVPPQEPTTSTTTSGDSESSEVPEKEAKSEVHDEKVAEEKEVLDPVDKSKEEVREERESPPAEVEAEEKPEDEKKEGDES